MTPKVSFQIATIFRENGYIHSTIDSLRETGFFDKPDHLPLHLVVGSSKSSYLDQYRKLPKQFVIDEMSSVEMDKVKFETLTPMQRAGLTHSRCLEPGRTNIDAPFILVFEDDLKFARGWIARLQAILDDVIWDHASNWVLCLYTALTDESAVAFRAGKKFFQKNYDWFFGTQATLYPRDVAESFALEILRKAVNPFVRPYDLLLSEFMKSNKVPILATAPCLVQHMGDVSQGVCGHFHQSKGFMDVITG